MYGTVIRDKEKRFSFDHETKTGEPNVNRLSQWSFDWFCEHSANECTILLDFGTCSFDAVFWLSEQNLYIAIKVAFQHVV